MTPLAELISLKEYWIHCTNYPHCISLNKDLFDELSGILIHHIVGRSLICHERIKLIAILIDTTTSTESTTPWGRDNIREWLDALDKMKSVYRQVFNVKTVLISTALVPSVTAQPYITASFCLSDLLASIS